MALDTLGAVCKALGDLAAARQHGDAAEALFAQVGDMPGRAICLINLAYVAGEEGDLSHARALTAEARTVFWERQDWFHVALVTSNLATFEASAGEWASARALVDEGLLLCETIDSVFLHANVLDTAVMVLMQENPTTERTAGTTTIWLRVENFLGRDITEQARHDALHALLKHLMEPQDYRDATARGERLTLTQALALAQPSAVMPVPVL